METLFNDSETFQKERPTSLTEKQSNDLFARLSKEIRDNNWSRSSLETISEDLKILNKNDSGYEMAKDLEGADGSYNIDTPFIEWLDYFDSEHTLIIEANQKEWVTAHYIKPKFSIGAEILLNSTLISFKDGYKAGDVVFINGHKESTGKYLVSSKKGSTSNYVVNYEKLESKID